jgi:hypothetical protein
MAAWGKIKLYFWLVHAHDLGVIDWQWSLKSIVAWGHNMAESFGGHNELIVN